MGNGPGHSSWRSGEPCTELSFEIRSFQGETTSTWLTGGKFIWMHALGMYPGPAGWTGLGGRLFTTVAFSLHGFPLLV